MSTRSGIPLPEIPERIDENPNASSLDGDEDQPELVANIAANNNSCDGSTRPSQLRLENRLRRWYVTFGNPALGTYAGIIVTIHPRSRRRQRLLLGDDYDSDSSSGSDQDSDDDEYEYDDESSDSSDGSFSSCSSLGDAPDLDRKRTQRIVVMVNVPPDQVPDGVLNLVRGHRPFIEHVRIVIGSSQLEEAEQRRRRWEIRAERKNYQEKENQENVRRSRSQTWA